ncbi:MAG: class I SAM-dependent methyltransferase [Steroidobacteraceae bacterium]
MPGNYHTECAHLTTRPSARCSTEVRSSTRWAVPAESNDATGRLLVAKLREQYPQLAPRRILDLGCTIGHNTLPLCDAFPDAEVHAVDVGAPMLLCASPDGL